MTNLLNFYDSKEVLKAELLHKNEQADWIENYISSFNSDFWRKMVESLEVDGLIKPRGIVNITFNQHTWENIHGFPNHPLPDYKIMSKYLDLLKYPAPEGMSLKIKRKLGTNDYLLKVRYDVHSMLAHETTSLTEYSEWWDSYSLVNVIEDIEVLHNAIDIFHKNFWRYVYDEFILTAKHNEMEGYTFTLYDWVIGDKFVNENRHPREVVKLCKFKEYLVHRLLRMEYLPNTKLTYDITHRDIHLTVHFLKGWRKWISI